MRTERIVLDPARIRIVLRMLRLVHFDYICGRVEDDKASGRGALIEGADVRR